MSILQVFIKKIYKLQAMISEHSIHIRTHINDIHIQYILRHTRIRIECYDCAYACNVCIHVCVQMTKRQWSVLVRAPARNTEQTVASDDTNKCRLFSLSCDRVAPRQCNEMRRASTSISRVEQKGFEENENFTCDTLTLYSFCM